MKKERLYLVILLGIIILISARYIIRPIEDPDFFWHIATGKWIVNNMALPADDPFAYTTPKDLGSREHFILTSYWLTQVIYYLIYSISGFNGITILKIFLGIAILFFIYIIGKRADRVILLSLIALAAMSLFHLYPMERPQVFSFLFFAILIYILEKAKEGKYNIFYLPLLMLIWSNMHGGHLIGQVVIVLYLFAETVTTQFSITKKNINVSFKRFLLICSLGLIASLLNPNTYKAAIGLLGTDEFASEITEYLSSIVYFRATFDKAILIYWIILLLSILTMTYKIFKKGINLTDLLMLAGLGYFSFFQIRHIAFFVIWAVPFIVISLRDFGKKDMLRLISILLSITFFIFLILLPREFMRLKNNINLFSTGRWVIDNYPEMAASFIKKKNIKGNMYNDYDWGGYLIWALYPGKKVFVDGRGLHYPAFKDAMTIANGIIEPIIMDNPAWKATYEMYGIKYVITPFYNQLSGSIQELVTKLLDDNDWAPVFIYGNSVIFVKRTPENYHVTYRFSIPKDAFLEDMIDNLDITIKNYPHNHQLYIAKGDLYCIQRRFKDARDAYEMALKINPIHPLIKEKLQMVNESY